MSVQRESPTARRRRTKASEAAAEQAPAFIPPRIGTPRNPERETRGAELVEVGEQLRKVPLPWQRHVADIAGEIDPATGDLWYEEVIVTVPRQSGKTTLVLMVLVWRCVILALELGAQTCTYLAQTGKMARRKLEREFARILRAAKAHFVEIPTTSRARPTEANEWKLSMNNGSEHILFGTDSYLQVEAPTETGSHGDVLDVSIIDEAFAHEDDEVEQATDAANITRRSPQSWIVSTAGNRRSRFLAAKVLAGRAAVNDPMSRTAYFEWSVPEDHPDWQNPEVWAQYLPALGHTITVERLKSRLDKALRNPEEAVDDDMEPGVAGFRRAYLNIWPEFPDFTGAAEVRCAIDPAVWGELELGEHEDVPQITGALAVGVGVGRGGLRSTIVAAGWNTLGRVQLEVIEAMDGTWWVEKRLRQSVLEHRPAVVAWPNGGPARAIAPDIQRATMVDGDRPDLQAISGGDWPAACDAFEQLVTQRVDDVPRMTHLGDVALADAIGGTDWLQVGNGRRWNVNEARADASPLEAATAAVRALMTIKPPEAPARKKETHLW